MVWSSINITGVNSNTTVFAVNDQHEKRKYISHFGPLLVTLLNKCVGESGVVLAH